MLVVVFIVLADGLSVLAVVFIVLADGLSVLDVVFIVLADGLLMAGGLSVAFGFAMLADQLTVLAHVLDALSVLSEVGATAAIVSAELGAAAVAVKFD